MATNIIVDITLLEQLEIEPLPSTRIGYNSDNLMRAASYLVCLCITFCNVLHMQYFLANASLSLEAIRHEEAHGPTKIILKAFAMVRAGALVDTEAMLKKEIKRLLQMSKDSDQTLKDSHQMTDMISMAHGFRLLGHIKHKRKDYQNAERNIHMACELMEDLYGAPYEAPDSYSYDCYHDLVDTLRAQRKYKHALDIEAYIAGDGEIYAGNKTSTFSYAIKAAELKESGASEVDAKALMSRENGIFNEDTELADTLVSIVQTFAASKFSTRRRLLDATQKELLYGDIQVTLTNYLVELYTVQPI